VLTEQPGAVEAYLDFLRSGGAKFPLETLQTAGVDMTTPAPIESTLQLFNRRLTELEALLI
jgi:oligoendopeptidase F